MKSDSESKEHTFLRHMDCLPPMQEADEAFKCVSLQWVAAGSTEEGQDVEKEKRQRNSVVASEWFGVAPFQSILSTIYVVWARIALHPFLTEPLWSSPRLLIKNFSWEYATKGSRVHK